jgi:hypothetical protein
MSEITAGKDALFATLPPVWPEPLLDEIRRRIEASRRRLVILDDDPTGAQTSHGVPVLTQWTEGLLTEELAHSPAFFLLTNSRALDEAAAVQCAEIGAALRRAARRPDARCWSPAQRLHPTGHFPPRLTPCRCAAESPAKQRVLPISSCPLLRGRRAPHAQRHSRAAKDQLVPAAQTEFAATLLSRTVIHLPSWVERRRKVACLPRTSSASRSTTCVSAGRARLQRS